LFTLDDGKEPDAFRTIGEVAKAFNLRQHVLRYWEEQFPMLRPLTRAGGRRYYRAEDVALVAEISRLLYQEGFTIRGARQALAGWGKGGVKTVAPAPVVDAPVIAPAPVASQMAAVDGGMREQLQALRDQLASALDA
jgi:DNA-binding transcriptional MerR regulator